MNFDPLSLCIGLLAGTALAGAAFGIYAAKAKDAFRAASADALNANSQAFLALAEQQFGKFQESAKGDLDLRHQSIANTVAPVGKTLEELNRYLVEIEKARTGTTGELKSHLEALGQNHTALQGETARLAQALRSPLGRGSWGEMQLERLLEVAGFAHGVHYQRQVTAAGEDSTVRPDIVVKITDHQHIIIDAKTPMDAYFLAMETADDVARSAHLKTHAQQLRETLRKLSIKNYPGIVGSSPDYVVMFVPSEGAVASALQNDLELIETAIKKKVVIATPMTLFALLSAIMYGWRQEKLAKNTQEIADLGAQLYDRIGKFAETYQKIGDNLKKTVDVYNGGIGQVEARILTTARKLKSEHAVSGDADIPPVANIESTLRYFSAPEMLSHETET